MFLGLRTVTTSYVYDDPDHPTRVTSTIPSPAYVVEDRALLMGLQQYEDELCGGCGQPRSEAWHGDMDGWYEQTSFVCHACTAKEGHQRAYRGVKNTRPESKPLSPLVLGVNTTEADPPPKQRTA